MNAGVSAHGLNMKKYRGALNDPTELGRWRNVLDSFGLAYTPSSVSRALQLARESLHPDAQWLASLFPAGTEVARWHMTAVMCELGDDPGALYIAWRLAEHSENKLLQRSAEKGYAPAQAKMAAVTSGDDSY
jgi:hypothetical protein